jgi:hypothetical protein
MFCAYYQAVVNVPYTWFITGVFRSEENFVFDRAREDDSRVLEFFVPVDYEEKFLSIMQYFQDGGYVLSFEKIENRLK